MFEVSLAGR